MPKEYINYPPEEDILQLQISLGMPDKDLDGKLGPKTIAVWEEELELPPMGDKPDSDDPAINAPLPMVGLHWDGKNEVVQLSLDIDWNVLQEMVKQRQELPDANFADDNSFLRNRVTFYTGALSRDDLQRLVRVSRRARNAVFGADE